MTIVRPDSASIDCLPPLQTQLPEDRCKTTTKRGRLKPSSTDKSLIVSCVLARRSRGQNVEPKLGDDVDAHGPGGTANGLGSSFDRSGVHVRHLLGGDLENLLLGHLTDLLFVRSAG